MTGHARLARVPGEAGVRLAAAEQVARRGDLSA
jgi:hypothetical protein